MTIFHRLKVWCIKGYRLVKSGFKWARARELNTIFLQPVLKKCHYCGEEEQCVILECDYEVYATICGDCLKESFSILYGADSIPQPLHDNRGVVVH